MKLFEPGKDERTAYETWRAERPPSVQTVARHLDPWTLYLMPKTTQLVTVVAISEDGTVRITAWGRQDGFDLMYPRGVFGVNPADLVPAPHGSPIPEALCQELAERGIQLQEGLDDTDD